MLYAEAGRSLSNLTKLAAKKLLNHPTASPFITVFMSADGLGRNANPGQGNSMWDEDGG